VATLAPARISSAELGIEPPTDGAELAGWLAAGTAVMDGAFSAADPDAPMWAWGADKHARFWPRRMLHETAVHRADAEIALGRTPALVAPASADGIDELLDNIPHAGYFAPGVALLVGDGETLVLVAADLGEAWRIRLEPDGYAWAREPAGDLPATGAVTADAGDLLLWMYGRIGPDDARVAVSGDGDLVARWRRDSAL
jgi:uncharacterized protein (TIGR03083 family)